MDISKEAVEKIKRKSLGEDCWITVGDGIKIKVNYLEYAQEMEFNRLSLLWNCKKGNLAHSHHFDYFFRCAVKDLQGITIEGKEAELTFKDGLARDIITDEIKKDNLPEDDPKKKRPLDIVRSLVEMELFEEALYKIIDKIEYNEADKKKLQSAQDSAKTESSQPQEKNSSHAPS